MEDDRSAYRDVLTEAGFSVHEVADPWSAYQKAVADLPAIIVADIRMTGPLDGIEVTRKLKSNKATRPIPIIVLIAYADDDTLAERSAPARPVPDKTLRGKELIAMRTAIRRAEQPPSEVRSPCLTPSAPARSR